MGYTAAVAVAGAVAGAGGVAEAGSRMNKLLKETAEIPYRVGAELEEPSADVEAPATEVEAPATEIEEPSTAADSSTAAESSDIDVIEELGDEIATLAAHIHAATHRFLVLIARFDRMRGWEAAGYANCAQWLHMRTGIDLGTAREKVRAARALESLPLTGEAMARGELSFSKVRALTRVATTENEADLLELARGAATWHLERMVRGWKRRNRHDEREWERELHRSRMFSVFPDDDGMYVVKGRLMPEVGALLMKAVEAAADSLFRESWVPGVHGDVDHHLEAARRRADAVVLLAERALAAGFGVGGRGCAGVASYGGEAVEDSADGARVSGETSAAGPRCGFECEKETIRHHVSPETSAEVQTGGSRMEDGSTLDGPGVSAETSAEVQTRGSRSEDGSMADHPGVSAETSAEAQACGCGSKGASTAADHRVSGETSAEGARCGCKSSDVPISGNRAERYQVVLHVEPATLSADEEPGRSELEDGTRVSAETSRRLSCDAGVVVAEHGGDGSLLSVGRKTRTVPSAIRRALEIRDRGCRFPGCGRRFTDAHHVRHWADGGETSLSNCLLLCGYHHRLVHEGGWRIEWWGKGRPMFISPRGEMRFDGRWEAPVISERPVEALIQQNRLHGSDPDGWTAGARWEREDDVPDAVYFKATEAI